MLKEFLKEVVINVAGKQAEEIADLLNSKKHVNEFIIAKKTGMTINQTRNILYKIADYGLVSFERKKDKKKGWYTYFWKIEVVKSLEFLKDELKKRIEQIENQIKRRENTQFYICERCNIELSEENAMLQDFTCKECGEVFTIKDDSKLIKELDKNLEKFKHKLGVVEEELGKENEKIEKAKEKERIKEASAKKAAKKKAIKKTKKKIIKKKAAKKKIVKRKTAKKKAIKKIKKKIIKKKSRKKKK